MRPVYPSSHMTFDIYHLLLYVCGLLTVMRHAQTQAFLEAAVLAFVPALFLDFTGTLTSLILQLHTNGASEKSLGKKKDSNILLETARHTLLYCFIITLQKHNFKDI